MGRNMRQPVPSTRLQGCWLARCVSLWGARRLIEEQIACGSRLISSHVRRARMKCSPGWGDGLAQAFRKSPSAALGDVLAAVCAAAAFSPLSASPLEPLMAVGLYYQALPLMSHGPLTRVSRPALIVSSVRLNP